MPGSNPPLVSAILPAYNAERFVSTSIASVLSQSHANLELIVVDDGSTDSTPALIAAAARRDPRVRVLRQANSGVAAARNRAIGAARGKYIAPIDADDVWFPDKLAKQVQGMETDEQPGVAYAWSVRLDAAGRVRGRRPRPHVSGWVYPAFVYKNFCSASAPLIRRDCLLDVGGYDTSLRAQGGEGCEDLDLLLRLAWRFPFALVPEYLLGYRIRPGSMSTNVRSMERSHRIVMSRVERTAPTLPARILRWSRSEFCLHLLAKCQQAGDCRNALKYLQKAVWYDPGLLRMRHIHQMAFRASMETLGLWRPHKPVEEPGRSPSAGRTGARQRKLEARVEYVRRCSIGQGTDQPGSPPNGKVDGAGSSPRECAGTRA